jgi:hypothetical protein
MQDIITIQRFIINAWKGGRVQIFGYNFNESKFYSGRNYEQIEVGECLLSFSAEPFVIQFAIQKLKD